jgi:hypothetical protein
MGIAIEAPRGGLVENICGETYPMLLRLREIERFEDKYRGVFDLWEGFFRDGKMPSSSEVRDLIALGLIGAGMKEAAADTVLQRATPEDLQDLYSIARALLGCAFMPDIGEAGRNDEKKDEPRTD